MHSADVPKFGKQMKEAGFSKKCQISEQSEPGSKSAALSSKHDIRKGIWHAESLSSTVPEMKFTDIKVRFGLCHGFMLL